MTERLERAIARVRALPEAMQDDAARMLLRSASLCFPGRRGAALTSRKLTPA